MRRTLLLLTLALGCTSLGQGGRAVPKIARPTDRITEVGLDSDDNDLALAVERLLDERGIKSRLLSTPLVRQQRGDKEYTYDEVQTRYVLRVRSNDEDKCIPEGSRQMDWTISVTDFQERRRVFLSSGEHGCRDTILKNFESWLASLK